jgi:heme/copper-type cytochrome/quinol oxidase subunit 2
MLKPDFAHQWAMQSSQRAIRTIVVLAAIVLIAAAGIAVGFGFGATVQISASGTTVTSTVSVTNSSEPYTLTLVITTGNFFNSTVEDQPAYYVLGPSGLESSANVSIPVNTTIKLVIVNYDDGNASMIMPNVDVVMGTTNGTEYVASNNYVNSSEGANGIDIIGGQTVSSVLPFDIAHTFTVPSLNLNLPIPESSIVVAYFTVSKAGTFLWFCETGCGYGPNGTLGAMSTAGWMTGSLVAQ